MNGIKHVVQWLSTAFVIVMAVAWWAVGHPGRITTAMWDVQDLLAGASDDFANWDADLGIETDAMRDEEDDLARQYEDDFSPPFITNWHEETRPLGDFESVDGQ